MSRVFSTCIIRLILFYYSAHLLSKFLVISLSTVHFFSIAMQEPLSAKCLEVVEKAFAKLDKTGDGLITSEDLRK